MAAMVAEGYDEDDFDTVSVASKMPRF